jgi:hypothetical protein
MPAEVDNFEFVERLYSGALAKRADVEGIDKLSRAEQNVVLAWWAKGEIDNGGFALLYAHPIDIDRIAEAFSEIGASDAADACLLSKNKFKHQLPPLGEERIRIIRELDDVKAWIQSDRKIWALGTDFDDVVARYIRENHISD